MTWVSADEEEGSGLRGHCCDESDDRASTGPSAAALRLLVPALTHGPGCTASALVMQRPAEFRRLCAGVLCSWAVRPWTRTVCVLRAVSQSLPRLPRLGCPCWDGTSLCQLLWTEWCVPQCIC